MFTFTTYDLLAKNLPDRHDAPAVIVADKQVTYGELAGRCESLAAWLAANGVKRGDRVGIHLRKSVEEVVATFAAARMGAVVVNVNYQWTARQLQYILQDCQIKLLITDRRRCGLILKSEPEILSALDRILVSDAQIDHPKVTAWSDLDNEAVYGGPGPIGADLAALMYTSGSTGKPKGVMFTHDNVVQGARIVACYLKNTAADRVLGLLPMSFDYGMSQVTTMFLVGGSVVLQPVVVPAEIVKTLVSQRVTGMAAVPPAWIQVVRYLQEARTPLPSLRYVTNSGGKIPQVILEAMPAVFPGVSINLMYGLTEAFRSTYLPPELFAKKTGAIGRAIPNVEVFVVDPQKGLCPPGVQGELVHRGALISRGYWGNPQATADKLKPCDALRPLIGDEPVLFSGDLVRLDEDGILWFIGRADSMIKCSGYRISPTEVEEIVYEAPGVGDVVAFGVEDDLLGQVVHIAVAAREGQPLDLEPLQDFCKQNMPTYMVPARVHLWPGAMPRTSSGKIDRPAVIGKCKAAP